MGFWGDGATPMPVPVDASRRPAAHASGDFTFFCVINVKGHTAKVTFIPCTRSARFVDTVVKQLGD